MQDSLAPRLIRLVQAGLPLFTVLICMSVTVGISDSAAIQKGIHELHADQFTLQLSEHMLGVTKNAISALLMVSLPIFYFFKMRMAGHRGWLWERNYCIAVILACMCLALRLWQCPLALDDAYVDYRYVQHWLSGHFDYNPGDHVMGFTSHLHLFVVWLTCLLFRTNLVDMASFYLNCALDTIVTLFLLFFVARVHGRMLPGVVAALIYTFGMYSSGEVISGKETPLVSLMLLISMWALQTSRLRILPWMACGFFLIRPEGLLACLVVMFRTLRPAGKTAIRSFILPCSLTLSYFIFLYCYFHSVLPHGMIAKSKVFPPGDFFATFFDYVRVAGCIMTNSVLGLWFPFLQWWSFFLLTIFTFVYGYLRFKQPCWQLYRDIALVQMGFLVLVQPLHFSWYLCWFNLLGPIVTAQLVADMWPRVRADKLPLLVPQRAIMCLYLWTYVCVGWHYIPYDWIPYLERGTLYREAALYLMDRTQGRDTVAASDVGIIGYNYSGPILDLMGLVSDEPLRYYPVSTDKGRQYLIPPRAITDLKPKYVVAPVNHCLGMLMEDRDFLRDYTELKRWTNPQILDKVVCIWVRRDVLAPPVEKQIQSNHESSD